MKEKQTQIGLIMEIKSKEVDKLLFTIDFRKTKKDGFFLKGLVKDIPEEEEFFYFRLKSIQEELLSVNGVVFSVYPFDKMMGGLSYTQWFIIYCKDIKEVNKTIETMEEMGYIKLSKFDIDYKAIKRRLKGWKNKK